MRRGWATAKADLRVADQRMAGGPPLQDVLLLANLPGRLKACSTDIFQNTAQVKSGEVDPEVVDQLFHAKRLVSSFTAAMNDGSNKLRAGSAGLELQRLLSGGWRRAPTMASTSTMPSSPSMCCRTSIFSLPIIV